MTPSVKMLLTWIGVFAFRIILLPVRAPNVEPLLASIMPISAQSIKGGVLFAITSIVVYDAFTSGIGWWTLGTAAVYALVAIGSTFYFTRREQTRTNFLVFGVLATLFYDAATGLTIGPVLWHQSLINAFLGQIPFTLLHLAGTLVFASVLSPILARWYAHAPVGAVVTKSALV